MVVRPHTVSAALALLASIVPAMATADLAVKSQGELGLESRVFFPSGEGDDYNVAMVRRLTLDGKLKPLKLRVRGFARHDGVDRERSALFPEEAWLEYKADLVRFRVGYQMLNWTATEAFHPADVINSRYFDGNVQNPEKLGELMAAARIKVMDGNVEAFFMPRFTEPILPSSNSRYRFAPLGTTIPDPQLIDQNGEVSDDRWVPQWGVRAQQSFHGADVSAHVLQHVDRALPLVLFDPAAGIPPTLIYQWVTQVGGTYQQVAGPVIIKVEGSYRWFETPDPRNGLPVPDRNHALLAVGLEYGFGHDSGGESTFLLEAESAFGLDDEVAGLLLFQRDALIGYRYSHGDEADQSFTVSVIDDLEAQQQFFANLEYGRRIGETWRAQTGLRLIHYPPKNPAAPVGPEFLDNANYGYLNLTRFF